MPQFNLIFTGRKTELRELHAALQARNTALTGTIIALHGMAGVGKTQTAARYVHLHYTDYKFVFWTRGQTPTEFNAYLVNLHSVLGLPREFTAQVDSRILDLDPSVPSPPEQRAMFDAVQHWFSTHGDWLLVVDNVEQLSELRPFLPRHPNGRVLLTMREPVPIPLAHIIKIRPMDEETGALLLLRRAEILTSKQELNRAPAQVQEDAMRVSAELGGLALALDQAGAYMRPDLSPAEYLEHRRQRRQLLYGDYDETDHPPADVTFSLALEQVRQIPEVGTAAAELAQLCAFFAPDVIPDEIFLSGSSFMGEVLAPFASNPIDFRKVYLAACRYELMRRESNPSGLWIHRLAQEVIRDGLSSEQQRTMFTYAVRALDAAFPEVDVSNWPLCERLLVHVLYLEPRLKRDGQAPLEAVRLLNNAGVYLRDRAQFAEARRLQVKSLAILRQTRGAKYATTPRIFNDLARLYLDMGRPKKAVSLLKEALKIDEALGKKGLEHAQHFDTMAWAYTKLGQIKEAEEFYSQALIITEQACGLKHREVTFRLHNLADMYSDAKRYDDAIPLYNRAINIYSENNEKSHPYYAVHLYRLAGAYVELNRPKRALPMLKKAREVLQQERTSKHLYRAQCLYWSGRACFAVGEQREAAMYFREALAIFDNLSGPKRQEAEVTREWLAKIGGLEEDRKSS